MTPKSILFVCLGNICRSPVAQGVFQYLLNERIGSDLSKNWILDSAGTSNYHTNEPPDIRAQQSTLIHDIDISHQRSRQFKLDDFDKFDQIFVMDASNYTNVLKLSENPVHKNKIHLFLDSTYPDENRQVPDPYFGGNEGFENVFQMLKKASLNWLNIWTSANDSIK
tara:strand:- start:3174 stop:3674 length:501 start_codon:yes stop_codon:yes gene_type:complete